MQANKHIQFVSSFNDLISTNFHGNINVIGWKREIKGDFSEIVQQLILVDNITEISENELLKLDLTEQGQRAR